jgi:hypothetical protein
MSDELKSYVGDIGTILRTTLDSDLTGYSTVEYKIIKPDATILTKTCVIEDVTDGIVWYKAIAGDLNVVGIYYCQVKMVFTDGDQFRSRTESFEIFQEFK